MVLAGAISILLLGLLYLPSRTGRRPVREPAAKPLERIDGAMAADLLGAALRAGASIPSALEALDTALEEEEDTGLTRTAHILLMGGTWQEAWVGTPDHLGTVRDALEPAWVDGAAPLPLLERCAETIRQGRERKAREAAAKLGSQLVIPLGLCFLPAFIVLGIVPVIAATGLSLFG